MIMLSGFYQAENSTSIRATAMLGDAEVFIEYHKVLGLVVDSTFNTNSDLFKEMDKEVRKVLSFKVAIEMNGDQKYTVRQINQLNEWYAAIKAAEKALHEMDLTVSDTDWLTEQMGQTSGSIIEALNEVRTAIDVRLSEQ